MTKRALKLPFRRVPFLNSKFPIAMTTPMMHFYLPICDDDPYAAFLLEQFQVATILTNHEHEQNQREEQQREEARLEAMSEEEREREIERTIDEGVEAYYDRMLNDYNGESWLNDEDDAMAGAEGYFDLDIPSLARKLPGQPEQESEQKLFDAYHLLAQKGLVRYAAGRG